MSCLQTGFLDGILVVRLKESKIAESQQAEEIGVELLGQVSRASQGKMLLDLDGVTFVCSAMIGQIGVPMPFSHVLERACLPQEDDIISVARSMIKSHQIR